MTTTVKRNPDIRKLIRLSPNMIPALGLILALVVGGVLIYLSGFPPFTAYGALIKSAFGSKSGIAETMVKAAPLLLAGLGIALTFKGNINNIGAEGQIYMGALGATFVGLFLGDISPWLGIPLIIIFGFIAGALWSGLAAFLKLRFNANEIIITLMLNYVAIEIAKFMISGPWRDPNHTEPFTAVIAKGAKLPVLLAGTRLHAGIIVGVLATVILWWVIRRTVYGYQLTILGANPRTAEYSGIQTSRMIFLTMLIGGGLCGLAGVSELAGVQHRMIEHLSPGYGYTAIAIALLGRGNPWGVLVASILFAGLEVGVQGMQQAAGVPISAAQILQGTVLLFVVAGFMLRNKLEIIEQKKKARE